jgi:hypothetical protein
MQRIETIETKAIEEKAAKCPFCAGDVLSIDHVRDGGDADSFDQESDRHYWFVVCERCYAQGPIGQPKEIIRKWNKRTAEFSVGGAASSARGLV